MTKEEIREWMRSAECVATHRYEDYGNIYQSRIYEKDGKLYLIELCNGGVSEKFGKKGYIRGEYELVEVQKREYTVQMDVTEYSVDGQGVVYEKDEWIEVEQ